MGYKVKEIVSRLCEVSPESAYSIHTYFMHWDKVVWRNRTQACQIFPVLAGIFSGALLTNHEEKVGMECQDYEPFELANQFRAIGIDTNTTLVQFEEIEAIQEAIDEGKPLIHLLSRVLHVRQSVLKHLVREKKYLINCRWLQVPKTLLYLLDSTPPEKWPRGNEEWQLLENYSYMLLPHHFDWMLEVMRFGIKRAKVRLDALAGGIPISYAIQNIRSVYISISHFISQYNDDYNGSDVLDRSIFEALAMSQKWHQQVLIELGIEAKIGDQDNGLTWPSIIDEPVEIRGITFIPLNNERVLVNEGVMQQHCVSGYVLECLQGKSHIFSLRGEENEILSTLELSINFWVDEVEIEVVQHRGKRNRPVTKRGWFMEQRFIKYLRSLPISRYEEFNAALYENMEKFGVEDGELSWSPIVSERTKAAELTALIKTFGRERLLSWGIKVEDTICD